MEVPQILVAGREVTMVIRYTLGCTLTNLDQTHGVLPVLCHHNVIFGSIVPSNILHDFLLFMDPFVVFSVSLIASITAITDSVLCSKTIIGLQPRLM